MVEQLHIDGPECQICFRQCTKRLYKLGVMEKAIEPAKLETMVKRKAEAYLEQRNR